MDMEMLKSTRHSKITGDFGEALILYWLSKHGFECARLDHTGIDLIARNPNTQEVMGISVKSRSRDQGKEYEYLSIPAGDFVKAKAACEAFACIPYFAIVIDTGKIIRCFLLTTERLQVHAPTSASASGWKMSPKFLDIYAADPEIMAFEMETRTTNW